MGLGVGMGMGMRPPHLAPGNLNAVANLIQNVAQQARQYRPAAVNPAPRNRPPRTPARRGRAVARRGRLGLAGRDGDVDMARQEEEHVERALFEINQRRDLRLNPFVPANPPQFVAAQQFAQQPVHQQMFYQPARQQVFHQPMRQQMIQQPAHPQMVQQPVHQQMVNHPARYMVGSSYEI